MEFHQEDIAMKEKFGSYIKFLGFLLFFGLCITMLSKGVAAHADSEVKLNVKSVSIIKEGTFRLKVYNLSETQKVLFRSANPSIATVKQNGIVTGVSNGTTVITAAVFENDTVVATLQCDVLIGPAAISIKLTKSELVLAVGMSKTLKTIISPLNTVESPVFYSSDSAVAAVSSSGRIRAKEIGEVQIFAFLANGQNAICTVKVLSEEDYALYLENKEIPEESDLPEEESPVEDSGETEAAETEEGSDLSLPADVADATSGTETAEQ